MIYLGAIIGLALIGIVYVKRDELLSWLANAIGDRSCAKCGRDDCVDYACDRTDIA